MLKLNDDVLLLILEELQCDEYDRISLYSCLLVNKTWCEIIVPILWKNPWKHLKENGKKVQLDVIISHFSDETKENLRGQDIIFPGFQQKPLFNYIGFCRYLNLHELEKIISTMNYIDESKMFIIRNEIFKLFINKDTKFTHLSIPPRFNYQIHLIPGAEYCFSNLKFLQCNSNNDQDILEGLSRISQSIKELEFNATLTFSSDNNSGVVKLIEAQKNLNNVSLNYEKVKSIRKTLEESLSKNANTVQYLKLGWKPITEFLSSLVNLVSLEFKPAYGVDSNWSHLDNLSLPFLKILKAQSVPSKVLANLIKTTNGYLSEISIYLVSHNDDDNKRLIQAIYQNAPILKYLRLLIKNSNISEFEKLLINCQFLIGLIIITDRTDEFDWNDLFKILTKSSPSSLFKFQFYFYYDRKLKSESLRLFFDDWRVRQPMLIQTIQLYNGNTIMHFDLIEKYRAKGIVKKYDNDNWYGNTFEDIDIYISMDLWLDINVS